MNVYDSCVYVCIIVCMKLRIQITLSEDANTILEKQPNKSQFIEDLILGHREPLQPATGGITREEVMELIKSLKEVKVPFVPKPPDPDIGYPCCTGKNPCKHWVWDDVDTLWKNTITGATRDE